MIADDETLGSTLITLLHVTTDCAGYHISLWSVKWMIADDETLGSTLITLLHVTTDCAGYHIRQ